MITGVMSLLMVVSGVGLLHKLHLGLPGVGHRQAGLLARSLRHRRHRLQAPCAQGDLFMIIAFVLAITAVAMVYVKPF
jgi:hypothetical protein